MKLNYNKVNRVAYCIPNIRLVLYTVIYFVIIICLHTYYNENSVISKLKY